MTDTTYHIIPSISDSAQHSDYPGGDYAAINYIPGLAVALSGGNIVLTITDHTGGGGQNAIEQSANGVSGWTQIALLSASTISYSIASPAAGVFYFRARSLVDGIYSQYTNPILSIVVVYTPSSISAVVSGGSITVSITDTNAGAAQHVLEKTTNAGSTWTTLTTLTAGVNSFVDSGLAAGSYAYRVRALISGQYSGYVTSSTATVTSSFSFGALYDFTGLGASGTALQDFNTSDGGQFQMVTKGGFGSYISNAQSRGGRLSLRTTIKAGTFGYGDVSDTTGRFGFNILFPNSIKCVAGDTLHMIFAIFFDGNFDTRTNTGILKFLRFLGDAASGSPYGNLDHCIVNDYGYIEGDTPLSTPNWMHGLMWGNEANHAGEVWKSGYGFVSGIKSNRNITRGQWCIVEHRQKFSTDPAVASRTTWIDGQLVADFTGNTKTYINASGVLTTLTGGQVENIAAGVTIDMCRLFTYFNNASPQDQGVWVDRIGFYRIPSGQVGSLPNTDERGNKFIGLGVL